MYVLKMQQSYNIYVNEQTNISMWNNRTSAYYQTCEIMMHLWINVIWQSICIILVLFVYLKIQENMFFFEIFKKEGSQASFTSQTMHAG